MTLLLRAAGEYEPCAACPHDSRSGALPDADNLVDSLRYDGLWDAFNDYHIGVRRQKTSGAEYGISRECQDAYARSVRSKKPYAIDTDARR